ncbi:MAG: hypothetical protein KAH01_05450 [Caldisericia bacterium]|nr:hypothetical protein [Caldisericia bacterium]
MAIEKLHLLRFVVPKKEVIRFRNTLYKKGVMHLKNVSPLSQAYLPDDDELKEINQNIEKAEYAIKVLEGINPEKKAFINNFIPKRPIFTTAEMEKIEKEIVFHDLHSEIYSIAENKKKALEHLKYKELILKDLIPFKPFKFSFSDISKYERTTVYFLKADGRSINDLEQFTYLKKNAVIIPVYEEEDNKKKIAEGFIVAFPTKILSEAILYLRRAGLKEFTFRDLTMSPIETIGILEKEIYDLEKNIQEWDAILLDYSKQSKHFYLWKDFLKNKHDRANGVKRFAEAKRVTYVEGYIPADIADEIIQEIASEYSNIYIDKLENVENPPVKFKNNKWVQPFEFLIKMYGIPRIGMIDPTALVGWVFIILFGLAFADGIYGLSLMALSAFAMKKCYYDKGTVSFFQMFFFAGLFAFIFGALTESWAGDLISVSYLPKESFLIKIKDAIGVINPSNNFVAIMVAVIYLGALLQCIGIAMAFLQKMKEKNYKDAILNSLSWILFIPGSVFVAGQFLVPGYYPELLVTFSTWVCLFSLVLIFIGGYLNSGKNVFKGIIKGFLNIYGIKSSYGVATLLGDVLSYLRLAALMVATSSMAMSFNLIAGMFNSIPVAGAILVAIMILILNAFNFLLNIIGSFVHPVRLLFYEMFSRFYESGGTEYNAYSQSFNHVFVIKEAKK